MKLRYFVLSILCLSSDAFANFCVDGEPSSLATMAAYVAKKGVEACLSRGGACLIQTRAKLRSLDETSAHLIFREMTQSKVAMLWNLNDEIINSYLDSFWRNNEFMSESAPGSSILDKVQWISQKPLYRVSFKNNKYRISDKEAQILSQSQTIQSLNLAFQNLSVEGASFLLSSSNLRVLDLKNSMNLVEDYLKNRSKYGEFIGTLKANISLVSLSLAFDKIDDSVAADLSKSLSNHPRLVQLDLSHNSIGLDGATQLLKNFLDNRLELFDYLNLSGNHSLSSDDKSFLLQNLSLQKEGILQFN